MTDQNKAHEKKPSKLRRFLYSLSWAAIWPVVIVVPAAILALVILSAILTASVPESTGTNAVPLTDGIFYFELYILISVTVLVIILQLVKWLLRTRKHLFFRSGARVLGAYIWLGLIATGLIMAFITKNPEVIKPQTTQDSQLMAVLETVGGDKDVMKDVSLNYVDSYEVDTTNGQYQPFVTSEGDFSYGVITVKKGLDPEWEKGVVAHEYLHHVWETQLDDATIHDMTSQLMTLYGNDDWIKNRTDWYSDSNMLLPTELFSFYCTEVSDRYLTSYVLETCNTYIDRSKLTFTR